MVILGLLPRHFSSTIRSPPVDCPPMSRRARRRKSAGVGTGGWLGRAAVGLLVAGVVCAAVGYWSLKNYLHSDAFRKLLSARVSQVVGMEGEFSPFRWDGLVVDTGSFEAKGKGPVVALYADRLRTEVNLSGVRRGVWDLDGATVSRVEVEIDARTLSKGLPPGTPPPSPAGIPPKPAKRGWIPQEVEVKSLELRSVSVKARVDAGDLRAEGMHVHLEHAGARNSYRGEIDGGRFRLPFAWLPEVELDRARFRYRDGEVFVTDATARVFRDGLVEGSGEWNIPAARYTFEGTARGIKCDEFLNDDWAKRLTGDASTTVVIESRSAGPVVKGRLTIRNGVLTALPVLDTLAAYADTRRFRVLNLSEAQTDWQWQRDSVTFENLVLASEGLVRLEGSLTIRGRELDGRFRLGLAPGSLSTIPGAETVVFRPGERGLMWSPLVISGTLDDPKEDLTDRLTAAAESRMFEVIPETGERVLKFTRSLIEDTQPVQKGAEILDKAADTILREGSGLIDGILGGGSRPAPTPPPQAPPSDSRTPPADPAAPKPPPSPPKG